MTLNSIYSLDSATLESTTDAIYAGVFSCGIQDHWPFTLFESSNGTPFHLSNEFTELSLFFEKAWKTALFVYKKARKLDVFTIQ